MPQPPMASAAEVEAWVQKVEDRLARLEGKRTAAVGGWVLQEQDGRVVAVRRRTGAVVVLAEDVDDGDGVGDGAGVGGG